MPGYQLLHPLMPIILQHQELPNAIYFQILRLRALELLETKRVNESPRVNCNDNFINDSSTSTTSATTILEKELKRPFSYQDDPIEESVGVGHSDVILYQGRVSQTLSEQFHGKELKSGKLGRHTIENPSVDPSCSPVPPITCADYNIPYVPRDMKEGSKLPVHSFALYAKEDMSTSDLYNGNSELVQIIRELKERAAALEKKQVESELEM